MANTFFNLFFSLLEQFYIFLLCQIKTLPRKKQQNKKKKNSQNFINLLIWIILLMCLLEKCLKTSIVPIIKHDRIIYRWINTSGDNQDICALHLSTMFISSTFKVYIQYSHHFYMTTIWKSKWEEGERCGGQVEKNVKKIA